MHVMARPYQMPRDEATEENYRRLERLLRELYLVLRALFTGDAAPLPARSLLHQPPPPPPPPAGQGPAFTVFRVETSVRPKPMSYLRPKVTPVCSKLPPSSPAYWTSLGRELRDIADSFQSSRTAKNSLVSVQT